MAADRVADDLDQRLEVVVEELGVEPGGGVRVPHQRTRGGRVEAALLALLQLRRAEREEVGALPSLDVDHLDVLARLHLVGECRGPVDLEVEARVGERVGEDELGVGRVSASGAGDLELQIGRGDAAFDHGRAGGRRDLDDGSRSRTERLLGARRRRRPEELGYARPAPSSPTSLGSLAAVEVPNREPVVRPERDGGRPAGPDTVRLPSRVSWHETRDEEARARLTVIGVGRGRAATPVGPFASYAFAGSFASAAAASARSCSASSRFAAESSFLTSFSTARRL